MNETDGNLALLLARLTWPSSIVRERAASAIAELLADPKLSIECESRLLDWISAQPTESTAVIGLLVLWRATQLSSGFVLPPTSALISALRRPSILSRMILEELDRPDTSPIDCQALCTPAPEHFVPSTFFTKYIRTFVAPWYSVIAEGVERDFGIPFARQWAFESSVILGVAGREEAYGALNFRGEEHGEHYGVVQTFLSDVYLSAYLRTLAWAVAIGRMSEGAARSLAAETCPIDLALWGVAQQQCPEWWPPVAEPTGQVDTVPAEIWRGLSVLWQRQTIASEGRHVVHASGRVYEGKTVYEIDIFGVFQKTFGQSAPDLHEIAAWCGERPLPGGPTSYLRFVGDLGQVEPDEASRSFGGWSLVPAAMFVRSKPFGHWQAWRSFREIYLPAPYVVAPARKFCCGSQSVDVVDDDVIVAESIDWAYRLKDTNTANLPPSTGNCLTVDSRLIRQFERQTRSAFAWICRLSGYHREHTHEAYKKFEHVQSFGTRMVILP